MSPKYSAIACDFAPDAYSKEVSIQTRVFELLFVLKNLHCMLAVCACIEASGSHTMMFSFTVAKDESHQSLGYGIIVLPR